MRTAISNAWPNIMRKKSLENINTLDCFQRILSNKKKRMKEERQNDDVLSAAVFKGFGKSINKEIKTDEEDWSGTRNRRMSNANLKNEVNPNKRKNRCVYYVLMLNVA